MGFSCLGGNRLVSPDGDRPWKRFHEAWIGGLMRDDEGMDAARDADDAGRQPTV